MAGCSDLPAKLDTLPGVWRGGALRALSPHKNISTGYKELDEVLPGGGWSLGSLTEILSRRTGCGELTLMLPALAHLGRQNRWVSWIAPPYIPYAPALAAAGIRLSRMLVIRPRRAGDLLWSAEQALRHGNGSAVLFWLDTCNEHALRRLQLAAAEGGSWGVLFRSDRHAVTPSPAALRLTVDHSHGCKGSSSVVVDIIKCRGGRPVNRLQLPNVNVSGSVP